MIEKQMKAHSSESMTREINHYTRDVSRAFYASKPLHVVTRADRSHITRGPLRTQRLMKSHFTIHCQTFVCKLVQELMDFS